MKGKSFIAYMYSVWRVTIPLILTNNFLDVKKIIDPCEYVTSIFEYSALTLTVLVTTIDALRYFETG